MTNKKIGPLEITEEHLLYLDDLRNSGIVNMFGAAPYLKRHFEMSEYDARETLLHWMQTYGQRHPKTGTDDE